MKNSLLYLIVPLIAFTSCASHMSASLLRPDSSNCIGLPALEPIVDNNSLDGMYPVRNVYTTDESNITTSYTSRSAGAQDILILFEREVKDCITNPIGEKKGYIYCIFTASKNTDSYFFMAPFTLFLSPILGIPLARARTIIEMDVEIYNNENKLIGRYKGSGSDKSLSALYYGYKLGSLNRVSAVKAFRMAMDDVKQKIAQDSQRLKAELGN